MNLAYKWFQRGVFNTYSKVAIQLDSWFADRRFTGEHRSILIIENTHKQLSYFTILINPLIDNQLYRWPFKPEYGGQHPVGGPIQEYASSVVAVLHVML